MDFKEEPTLKVIQNIEFQSILLNLSQNKANSIIWILI